MAHFSYTEPFNANTGQLVGSDNNNQAAASTYPPALGTILSAKPTVAIAPASRTLYMKVPFNHCSRLTASLEFDMSVVTGFAPTGQPNDPDPTGLWAVALNVKNGNRTDGANDWRYGATCQYLGSGNITVNLGKVNSGPVFLFQGNNQSVQDLTFFLQLNLWRFTLSTGQTVASSSVDLFAIGKGSGKQTTRIFEASGSVKPDGIGAKTLHDEWLSPYGATQIDAVGCALVNHGGTKLVSARFRAFTVDYDHS